MGVYDTRFAKNIIMRKPALNMMRAPAWETRISSTVIICFARSFFYTWLPIIQLFITSPLLNTTNYHHFFVIPHFFPWIHVNKIVRKIGTNEKYRFIFYELFFLSKRAIISTCVWHNRVDMQQLGKYVELTEIWHTCIINPYCRSVSKWHCWSLMY